MKFDYIIIGSGIAGVSAAETLRKHSPNATICVISNEPHDPYSKVLLPFWLKGKIRFEQLFIRGYYNSSVGQQINSHAAPFAKRLPADPGSTDRSQNFWEKNNITIIYGEVTGIDRDAKELHFIIPNTITRQSPPGHPRVNETRVAQYGKLLIASGADARKLDFLGTDLPGVFYFRSLDDAATIKQFFDTWKYQRIGSTDMVQQYPEALARHRESRNVGRGDLGDCRASLAMTGLQPVIYGASFIALEFAGIFAYLGIRAKIFFRGPYFWHRLLDEQGGRLVENFLEQAGMEIHREEEIKKIQSTQNLSPTLILPLQKGGGEEGVGEIITDKRSYQCNFLGLGVGLEPSLEFAREAGLKINRGIITDEFLETNDPNIFTAGDVAEFYDVVIGRHHVLGNWLNSDMQGRTAAMNMLGAKKKFELVSSYSFTFDGRTPVPEAPEVLRAQSTVRVRNTGRFDICAIGDTSPEKPFSEKVFTDENRYMRIFIKNDCCVGAILINNASLRNKVTQAIKLKSSVKDLTGFLSNKRLN